MKQKAITKAITRVTRRTGLDRRWIPSTNHQPERRHGGDRRTFAKRSLSQPLETSDPQTSNGYLSVSISESRKSEANISVLPDYTAWTPHDQDARLEEEPPDDE